MVVARMPARRGIAPLASIPDRQRTTWHTPNQPSRLAPETYWRSSSTANNPEGTSKSAESVRNSPDLVSTPRATQPAISQELGATISTDIGRSTSTTTVVETIT
jgi:hypothetical protein